MNNWIFFAVIAGLGSSLSNFLLRRIQASSNENGLSFWIAFGRVLSVFILFSFFSQNFSTKVSQSGILWLVALGTLEVAGLITLTQMHAVSHLSLSTILTRLRLIITPFLGLLFFSEKFTVPHVIGYLIIFCGLSIAKMSSGNLKFDHKEIVAIRFAIITAFVAILMKLSISQSSVLHATLAMGLVPMLLIAPVTKINYHQILSFWKTKRVEKTVAILVCVSYVYPLMIATSIGPVGQVVAVYQSMMIFAVLGGIFILGERENMFKKIFGSIVTVLGILFLS